MRIKLFLLLFSIFVGLCSASFAQAATAVYYSVGQTTDDLKTGTPTVSLSAGVATFSVAQTGNIGVGDVVTYDTSQTCYISSKTSTSVWDCVSATGTAPADITDSTVVSIKRVFTSLSGAESGAPALLGTSDLVTGNFQLNFPCYYDTGADTTAVSIYGWTTGVDNFIKVYTPNNTATEANFSQRHEGVWDEGKYSIKAAAHWASVIFVRAQYTIIEGLQVAKTSGSGPNSIINLDFDSPYSHYSQIKSNIIKMIGGDSANGMRFRATEPKIYNNIAYDCDAGFSNWYSTNARVYNNTAYNCALGFQNYQYTGYFKNNLSKSTIDFKNTLGTLSGSYNASADGTADDFGGSGNLTNQNFSFLDEANDDFRLSPDDTSARDMGTDLSADASLAFSDDIMGNTRPRGLAWDIGAFEAPAEIFRSVGPGATTDLNTDSRTVTISGSTATFSGAMPDNVGVGDVLQYQVDSTYHLAFIHGRTLNTVYQVRKADGTAPTATPAGTAVSVFRSYTSLYNAERGVENTGIETTVRNFDDWTAGGDATTDDVGRDLVTNNEQWNIACYANGSTADTTAVTIEGWTTGEEHYLKVYTPVLSSEVGVSQRHVGKWDNSAYRFDVNANWVKAIKIMTEYLVIDGLQVRNTASNSPGNLYIDIASFNLVLSNSVLRADGPASCLGSYFDHPGNLYAYNNIFSGSTNSNGALVVGYPHHTIYIYNNTFINNTKAMAASAYGTNYKYLKNNLFYGNTYDVNAGGLVSAGTDYNATDNASIGYIVSGGGNVNDRLSQTFSFINAANSNFHLSPHDTGALGNGTDLSADSVLPFSTDIDGEPRARWDIGADEMFQSQHKMRGELKMRGDLRFR